MLIAHTTPRYLSSSVALADSQPSSAHNVQPRQHLPPRGREAGGEGRASPAQRRAGAGGGEEQGVSRNRKRGRGRGGGGRRRGSCEEHRCRGSLVVDAGSHFVVYPTPIYISRCPCFQGSRYKGVRSKRRGALQV